VSQILEHLHQDHIHMARVLDLIERELKRFNGNLPADLSLIYDGLHYLTQHGDRCHHPLEDRVFARLEEVNPSTREAVNRLRDEHESLYAKGKAFRDAVRDVESEAAMERRSFLEVAQDYLQHQRRHLDFEETTIFPMARTHISTKDWDDMDMAEEQATDPLFGSNTDPEYQRLRSAL